MGAGLYIPSAISTITALVRQENWGKALAIHELAPNLGLITAPILAEMFIVWFSWHSLLFALGVASLALGAIYARLGRGGDFHGQAPKPEIIKSLLRQRSFWIMMAFFSLGVGGSMGAYNMMTLYMVNEGGLDRGLANTILAVSRVSGLFAAFISGWVADRYGVKRALTAIFLFSGLATILLGFTGGSWLVVMVFLQAALSAAFFPAGLVALSGVGRPTERNVVVSLAIPMSFIIGGGIFPTGIGYLGEVHSFSAGFILAGLIILSGAVLVRFLKLRDDQPAEE
jgi:NNP family nitrate/nitrite transporter-like MFS transporter